MTKPTIPNRSTLRLLRPNELGNTKHHPLVVRCARIAASVSINSTYDAGSQIAAHILDIIAEEPD